MQQGEPWHTLVLAPGGRSETEAALFNSFSPGPVLALFLKLLNAEEAVPHSLSKSSKKFSPSIEAHC